MKFNLNNTIQAVLTIALGIVLVTLFKHASFWQDIALAVAILAFFKLFGNPWKVLYFWILSKLN